MLDGNSAVSLRITLSARDRFNDFSLSFFPLAFLNGALEVSRLYMPDSRLDEVRPARREIEKNSSGLKLFARFPLTRRDYASLLVNARFSYALMTGRLILAWRVALGQESKTFNEAVDCQSMTRQSRSMADCLRSN